MLALRMQSVMLQNKVESFQLWTMTRISGIITDKMSFVLSWKFLVMAQLEFVMGWKLQMLHVFLEKIAEPYC